LIHGQGVKSQPRELLKAIPGIHFVEVEGADQCCGSAGIYNITQNELSMEILNSKMEKIKERALSMEHRQNTLLQFAFIIQRARIGDNSLFNKNTV